MDQTGQPDPTLLSLDGYFPVTAARRQGSTLWRSLTDRLTRRLWSRPTSIPERLREADIVLAMGAFMPLHTRLG